MKYRVHMARAAYTFRDVEADTEEDARRIATQAARDQTKNWLADKVEPTEEALKREMPHGRRR